jgi:hypothetical protein
MIRDLAKWKNISTTCDGGCRTFDIVLGRSFNLNHGAGLPDWWSNEKLRTARKITSVVLAA